MIIIFWFYTVLFIIGGACLFKFLWNAIQPDAMLGKWQSVIDWAYGKSRGLGMFLGGCKICFAHLISILTFILLIIFTPSWILLWWQSIIFYVLFVPTVWTLALYLTPDNSSEDAV